MGTYLLRYYSQTHSCLKIVSVKLQGQSMSLHLTLRIRVNCKPICILLIQTHDLNSPNCGRHAVSVVNTVNSLLVQLGIFAMT